MERIDLRGRDVRRIVVYFVDEPEQSLVSIVERGRFDIGQDTRDERFVAQQFRRNCGVRLDSKGAVIALRGKRRDQFPHARTERRRPAQHFLRKARKVRRRRRQVCEEVPDLRVFGSLLAHGLDQIAVWARLWILLDTGEKHRIHIAPHARAAAVFGTISICSIGSAAGTRRGSTPSSLRTMLQPCAMALAL
jgi:hypothetical protein